MKIKNVSLTSSHTQRFGLTVSFRRKLLTLRQLYPSTFGLTLSHGRIICFYFANASARTRSDTASTCDAFVDSLRIICVLLTNLHTRRFGLTVSSRRCPSSFYESYRMGGTSPSTSLMPQLVQAVIPPQHDAFVDSKGSKNLLRINCVLLTNLHTQRGASAEKDPPAVLFSIHSLTLDRV